MTIAEMVGAESAPCIVRCLTLWQPWAFAVVHGSKAIENRPWHPWGRSTPPGRRVTHVLIHAGQRYDVEREAAVMEGLGVTILPPEAHRRDAIIGVARIAGCFESPLLVPAEDRRWWIGPHGWDLRDRRAIAEPVKARGALGLWEPSPSALISVLEQLGGLR